jgi:hypothetical protein
LGGGSEGADNIGRGGRVVKIEENDNRRVPKALSIDYYGLSLPTAEPLNSYINRPAGKYAATSIPRERSTYTIIGQIASARKTAWFFQGQGRLNLKDRPSRRRNSSQICSQ